MKKETFYKKVISTVYAEDEKIDPKNTIIVYAVQKDGEGTLLRSVLNEDTKGADQERLCSCLSITFYINKVEEYAVIFQTDIQGRDVIVICEVGEGEKHIHLFEMDSKGSLHRFTDFELDEDIAGLYTGLLYSQYSEKTRQRLDSLKVQKEIQKLWKAMEFELPSADISFDDLAEVFA